MNANLKKVSITTIFTALILSSCGFLDNVKKPSQDTAKFPVNIVIEDNNDLNLSQNFYEVTYGDDLDLSLSAKEGYRITGCDYKDYDLSKSGDSYLLTLKDIKYSSVVTIETVKSDVKIEYVFKAGDNFPESFAEYPADTHLKYNSAIWSGNLDVPGYTLTGWNTDPLGEGESICLGGRFWPFGLTKSGKLYGEWKKWTDPSFFTYEENQNLITITGYDKSLTNLIMDCELVIPGEIHGKKVTAISDNAFKALPADIDEVVLSPNIKSVGGAAFLGCSLKGLTVYDTLENISDYSFENCTNLKSLRINAATEPVYCGTYYATFADKMDYLESLYNNYKDSPVLVLFSGSSSRFGYDSPMIEEAFPKMKVANMGVFAYTNASQQLDLIMNFMKKGDILLDSPEFDASRRQFCVLNKFDDKFFNLLEENYSLMELLDLREYSGVFSAFNEYLHIRRGMDKRSYDLSPSDYDENFNPVREKSYNIQGDYCLLRPNAKDDDPVFDLPVDYTVSAFPQSYIDALNRKAIQFTDKGIVFLFTYAPRNEKAISSESTLENRKALDAYFRENFDFPIISDIEDSLYPGRYLFETDNHLSSEGVTIRTQQIIKDLKRTLK
jgi:hypothetical protein